MCGICGCSDDSETHHHFTTNTLNAHTHGPRERVQIERDLLDENQQYARKNQDFFQKHHVTAINLMSSPGSGKTTLLSRSIKDLKAQMDITVVVGDQQTRHDADVLTEAGAEALQINTGKVCHIDAHMLGHALENIRVKERSLLFIENIGNLVCPAMFELGESSKVVILSVTEGDNKPIKYPDMFRCADLVILTKTDLLPYVDFDIERCIDYAKAINPSVEIIELSAKTGEGLAEWYQWLTQNKTL